MNNPEKPCFIASRRELFTLVPYKSMQERRREWGAGKQREFFSEASGRIAGIGGSAIPLIFQNMLGFAPAEASGVTAVLLATTCLATAKLFKDVAPHVGGKYGPAAGKTVAGALVLGAAAAGVYGSFVLAPVVVGGGVGAAALLGVKALACGAAVFGVVKAAEHGMQKYMESARQRD